jgi:Cu(I)/Ag(I) efflux system membrane fusion protein
MDGWIENVGTATTGSVVHKGDVLGSFYNPEFLTSQQTFLLALNSGERQPPTPRQPMEGPRSTPMDGILASNVQRYADVLRNLGMADRQIEDLERSRKPAREIFIYAPADGVVLSRNISARQHFQRGAEWFLVADVSRVWVVVDVFENEARLIPGMKDAVLRFQGEAVPLHMSGDAPVFDPGTRALKVRFEAANLGGKLLPGMSGDVELQFHNPDSITVPVDAVSDNGSRKVVFVERSAGAFEPRLVATGPTFAGRVVVERGLSEGEKVVVAGNFLIASESSLHVNGGNRPQFDGRPESEEPVGPGKVRKPK